MTSNFVRITFVIAALWLSACLTGTAAAQCCGAPTTAYYQPAAYTAYSPVAVPAVQTGWYPGYFLDRIRARLFGSPSTYVAAYPTPYAASYPSTYAASYPSTYSASYPSTYVASYAPAYTSSYSAGYASGYAAPCTTCAPVQQVTMRPVVTTACAPVAPCDPCAAYGASGVSQASYESGGCASCGVAPSGGSTIIVPNGTVVTPGTQPANGGRQPELEPEAQVAPERTYRDRPQTNGYQQPIQPEPGIDANGTEDELEKVLEGDNQDSSTYFEAPKLFNPKDRTAQRSTRTVRTALYERPVSYHPVSVPRPVTAQQAKQDAAGWVSASH